MNNTPAVHKLTQAMLNGGKVTAQGITKRVLVEIGNGAAWYIVTMADGPQRTRTFTERREDCITPFTITGNAVTRWAERLEVQA
jgi:uncharacterized RmlC-like cupin family protein